MPTPLDMVYRFRQLAGKCEAGGPGLTFEEIDLLGTIGSLFGRGDAARAGDVWSNRREFVRERVDLPATLRGRGAVDTVRVINLGPGGVVCKGSPYLDEGDRVELLIDDEACLLSYRFRAEVVWLRDDATDGFELGLRFVGVPLLLRYRGQRNAVANAA